MNYYQLLEILPTATADQIRTAYRKKAFQIHPDRNKSPNAHQQFIVVRLAYEILSDPKKRAKYDVKLGVNKFPPIADQPSFEDAHLRDLYEEIEYFKHIHYDPIEEWVKLYRMNWKEWYTIPKIIKLKKIGAELIFRSLYALLGVFFVSLIWSFFFYFYFGRSYTFFHSIQFESIRSAYHIGMVAMASIFFIFAKGVGQIYRIFKDED